jgi:alkylated DNA nucleotide flippase Atl1
MREICSGQITHLFLKPNPGAAMQSVGQLALKVGQGIVGDRHAVPISPRQILLVRGEDLHDLSISPGALRENVVLSGLSTASFRPGARLHFPGGAAIRLTFYCEPCQRVSPLVASIKSLIGKRGILGVILSDGAIQCAQAVQSDPEAFPALPEKPFERFLLVLAQVPAGKVITYKSIIQAIGVADSYYRALPKYLQKAAQLGYPVHRVLDSEGCLIQHVMAQAQRLRAEGVEVILPANRDGSGQKVGVNLEQHTWSDASIYRRF